MQQLHGVFEQIMLRCEKHSLVKTSGVNEEFLTCCCIDDLKSIAVGYSSDGRAGIQCDPGEAESPCRMLVQGNGMNLSESFDQGLRAAFSEGLLTQVVLTAL